jgi:hypothetical protein
MLVVENHDTSGDLDGGGNQRSRELGRKTALLNAIQAVAKTGLVSGFSRVSRANRL